MTTPFPILAQSDAPDPRQVHFEYRRVRLVLARFGLTDQIPELIRAHRRKWDRPHLTFPVPAVRADHQRLEGAAGGAEQPQHAARQA